MTVVVAIDPNVRVDGNKTYAAFEDVRGGYAHINDHVRVQVDETDLVGNGIVSSLDWETRLVYLEVDWSSIQPDPDDDILQPDGLPALHHDRRIFPEGDVKWPDLQWGLCGGGHVRRADPRRPARVLLVAPDGPVRRRTRVA